ncbi:MAG: serine protease [Rhodospirillales bacterium]|nr:serine protease [Rhodospirillales bacterium]
MGCLLTLHRAAAVAAVVGALGAGAWGPPAGAANDPAGSAPGAAPGSNADPTKAVVGVRTLVPPEARSARTLGTERDGSGVLIRDDNLVVTIGYLLMEAHTVEVIAANGKRIPAAIVAYDGESGFGLLRTVRAFDARPVRLGDSDALKTADRVLALSRSDGVASASPARVMSRRTFAGYWEYLLDDAIFTSPPHLTFGGAARLAEDGSLVGIGSLFVNDSAQPETFSPGNMFVPVNALKLILAELADKGRRSSPPKPWLGIYSAETQGRIVVTRVADDSPAKAAGLRPGDAIVGVGGRKVQDLADLYRRAWAQGPAGVAVPLDVLKSAADEPKIERVMIQSIDRSKWLRTHKGF